MITLWGVWSLITNNWVAVSIGASEIDSRDRAATWGLGYQARKYGQFVRIPPEVVEAAKRLTLLMDVAESDERLILNWIAQAVTEVAK